MSKTPMFLKTAFPKFKKAAYFLNLSIYLLPIYADLPRPPEGDMPSGSNDWIDVGGGLAYKGMHYACIILGTAILVGAASGIVKAYHTAREKQDLSLFFTHGAISVIATVLGLGLLYGGYIIIPSR
jgi:hypothetical protein